MLSNFEPLVSKNILAVLDQKSSMRLSKLEIFDSIDSTNTYVLQQMKAHALSGHVCFAEEQTQGRGRLGRVWFSPKGTNIYCSMSWNFSQSDVSSLSIAIAVIIARVLKQYGVENNVGLKWPNDVLFSGRKLAGILLERTGDIVVIGVGLNVLLPEEMDVQLATSSIDLTEVMGGKVDRNYLAGLLVQELLLGLPTYADTGLKHFLGEWCEYDVLFNREVSVYIADNVVTGVMRGINENGELLLSDGNDLKTFRNGEVTVRLPGRDR